MQLRLVGPGVMDCLDVVAVGISYERAVIARVVFRPHPRGVEQFGSSVKGCFFKRVDFLAAASGERDMGLTKT